MLYAPNSRQDPDESFIPFDDRNYNGARDDPSHLQVYVETPPAISRKGTFINGHQFSPPFPSQTAPAGARGWTQADQSRIDSEKKKKAMKELVTSWQDRLQLISIITTFFAGMEAQLLGVVTPSDPGHVRKITQASLVGLSSALVVHTFAAILSFVAAFFLVRFRVKEAQHEEVKAELGVVSRQPTSQVRSGEASGASGDGTSVNVSGKEDSNDVKGNNNDGSGDTGKYTQQRSTPNAIFSELPIFSTDPHLEQVGPWREHEPPIALLDHCHLLCMMLSAIGFILAMVGIMCYVWAKLPLSSRVVTSVFGGFCIALGFAAIFAPVSFAPVSRALQSPAMSPQGLPTLNEQQQPLSDKLPGPRG